MFDLSDNHCFPKTAALYPSAVCGVWGAAVSVEAHCGQSGQDVTTVRGAVTPPERKCLLNKHEDLSPYPKHPGNKSMWGWPPVILALVKRQRQEEPSSSLAQLI